MLLRRGQLKQIRYRLQSEPSTDSARRGKVKSELLKLAQQFPGVIKEVRGIGFVLGIELATGIPAFSTSDKAPSIQMVNRLHSAGLLTIPAGNQVLRLLPAYNLRRHEADEGLAIFRSVVAEIAH